MLSLDPFCLQYVVYLLTFPKFFKVGVIQKKDPMGNPKRWFVDNGSKQGFLPADILNPIGDEEMKAINAYDDVAEDESVTDASKIVGETEVNAMEMNSSENSSKPEEQNACHESITTTANINAINDDSKEIDNKKQQMPVRKAPAPPVPSSQRKQSSDPSFPSDQRSNHSYEEIAASEVASEVRVTFIYKK